LRIQYLEEADELADRAGIISGGRMVAEGPPAKRKRNRLGLGQLGKSLLAIGVVGMVSMTMCFAAPR
jgi:ABC-type multidrug transport system ATPase subunit